MRVMRATGRATGYSITLKSRFHCHLKPTVQRSTWNDRFSDVYALCVAYPEPLGERLYAETKKFLEDHVTYKYDQVAACQQSSHLLQCFHQTWSVYNQVRCDWNEGWLRLIGVGMNEDYSRCCNLNHSAGLAVEQS